MLVYYTLSVCLEGFRNKLYSKQNAASYKKTILSFCDVECQNYENNRTLQLSIPRTFSLSNLKPKIQQIVYKITINYQSVIMISPR